jgi:hypothetical protein
LKGVGGFSGLPLFPSLSSTSTPKPNTSEHLPGSQSYVSKAIAPGLISVIGCGGCGVRFVSHLADRGIPDMHDGVRVEYFGIDNAGSAFAYVNKAVMKHFIVMGRFCEGWPSIGRAIAK